MAGPLRPAARGPTLARPPTGPGRGLRRVVYRSHLYPVTPIGRLIAVALMVYGIALLDVVTGTLASWLIQQVTEEEKKSAVVTAAHVERLSRELAELRNLLAERPQHPQHPG